MPSMTRRTALSAAVGVLSSIAGCAGLRDADSFPIQRSWYTRISDPSSVAMAQDGRLLTGSHSPFRDRPLVAGLDSQTGENNWTVTVAKARNHPSPSITGRPTQSRRLKRWLPSMWPRVSLSGNARARADRCARPRRRRVCPIPLDDRIAVPISGTEDDVPDRLVGVSRADGETLFTHSLSASLSGAPGTATDGVVVPLIDGRVLFLDQTGTTRWTRDIDASLSSVGVVDGTAYLGAATEELLAIDTTTGEINWRSSLANTVFARPLVTADRVYVGGADYTLRAFDAVSGQPVWRDELANAVTHGPLQVDDRLVTLVGGTRRVRGPSGTIPFSPTVLYVHEQDGTRVQEVRLDEHSFDGGSVEWAQSAGETVYLGQTFGLTRIAPEAIIDA